MRTQFNLCSSNITTWILDSVTVVQRRYSWWLVSPWALEVCRPRNMNWTKTVLPQHRFFNWVVEQLSNELVCSIQNVGQLKQLRTNGICWKQDLNFGFFVFGFDDKFKGMSGMTKSYPVVSCLRQTTLHCGTQCEPKWDAVTLMTNLFESSKPSLKFVLIQEIVIQFRFLSPKRMKRHNNCTL